MLLTLIWKRFYINPKPNRMKQRNFLTTVLALSILFFSCSKDKGSLAASDNGTIRAAGNVTTTGNSTINYTTRVSIQNSAFTPSDVTVMEGGSILWVNNDAEQVHTVTADDGSFDSGDIQPGGTFGFTFNTVGPYPYHCKYHKEMTGIVKCVTK
jgi:plastocyanin